MKWNPMSILRHATGAPIANRLLAALPRKDYKRLEEHLEPVPLEFGQVLHEPGGTIRYVYFPNNGAVSLVSIVSPQKGTEVGTVGSEGVVGISAAIGFDVSRTRAVVQGAGSAMKMLASRAYVGAPRSSHAIVVRDPCPGAGRCAPVLSSRKAPVP